MKFYTSIQQYNNVILERYIEDGVHKQREVPYQPTLFVPTVKQSPYKTITGDRVEPRGFNSIKEARDLVVVITKQVEMTNISSVLVKLTCCISS